VGTWPYIMVTPSASRHPFFDRNDNWWAAKIASQKFAEAAFSCFAAFPRAPGNTRVARRNQQQFDAGNVMQPGVLPSRPTRRTRTSSVERPGKPFPMAPQTPVLLHSSALNTSTDAWAAVHVRRRPGPEYAINRHQERRPGVRRSSNRPPRNRCHSRRTFGPLTPREARATPH